MQMAYNRASDKPRNNSNSRSRKSSPHIVPAVADISDEMRVQMASDLSAQLNSDLNLPNFMAYSDTAAIMSQLKGNSLVITANQLAQEYDGDLMGLDQHL